jgi:hypothetical protein
MNKKNNSSSQKKETSLQQTTEKKTAFSLVYSSGFWLKLIIIGQMVLLGLQFTPTISTNGDDATYYIIGKSIAAGTGYRNIQLIGAPVETNYPVIFPSFLAITHLFTHTPLLAKILVACLGCCATLASFYFFRIWAPWYLMPLVLLIGSLAVLNQHALQLLSEIPYVVLTLLALILLEKSYKKPNNKWLFWLTLFVAVLPLQCRSIGMAFSGAFIIANVVNKKYRYVVAYVGLLVASMIVCKMLTSWHTSYFTHLFLINSYDPEQGFATVSQMIARIVANITKYSSEILPDALIPSFIHANPGLAQFLGICFCLVILIGCVRSLLLPCRLIGIYAIFYCGILTLWQEQWSSGRFLAGILPFLLFLLFMGISTLWEFFQKIKNYTSHDVRALFLNNPLPSPTRLHLTIIWGIALLLTIDNIALQTKNADQGKFLTRDWVNFYSCADWIRQNTPKDATVVSRKAELVYIRSLRSGMLYPLSRDREKVISEIKQKKASYIIVDGFFWTQTTQRYLYPALSAHPELYRIVYAVRNPDTFVLQVINN